MLSGLGLVYLCTAYLLFGLQPFVFVAAGIYMFLWNDAVWGSTVNQQKLARSVTVTATAFHVMALV